MIHTYYTSTGWRRVPPILVQKIPFKVKMHHSQVMKPYGQILSAVINVSRSMANFSRRGRIVRGGKDDIVVIHVRFDLRLLWSLMVVIAMFVRIVG